MSSLSSPSLYLYTLMSIVMAMLSGCANYGVVENQPVEQFGGGQGYQLTDHHDQQSVGDMLIMLAFSGGGTRASALSYGVLKALRDTQVIIDGQQVRLLDEVDRISSVSGGSFTSAYYGLHGERIFDDYEQVFLRKNVQGALTRQLTNPFDVLRRAISRESHSEIAVRYYDKHIFHGATFADIKKAGPHIFINASDLEAREQFVFLQDNFDFLCSDLSTFKIARAVTASSAVPVVFDPIVLDNYDGCGIVKPEWLLQAESRSKNDPRLRSTVRTINGYLDKESHRYIHLVDGGITDNLGVRPLHTGLSLLGSENMATQLRFKNFPSKVIFVVVDASTNKGSGLGLSRKTPSLRNTISAVTNAQLHRYNTETIELIRQSLSEWAGAKSTSENPISTYYVQVSLDNIEDPEERRYFNGIPTSFSLTDEQVDGLIEIGGRLLRKDPEFRRLLEEMNIGRTL